jgi:hypothetical protein
LLLARREKEGNEMNKAAGLALGHERRSGSGAVCAKHSPCHSEASVIGKESACRQQQQQIPRATIPRFGMTILSGLFKLRH